MGGMALGLFSTLIIGTIIGQIGTLVGNEIGTYLIAISSVAKTVTGAGIGMMDANQAAKIMYADADAATIREKAAEYKNLQSSPLSAAKRGYVDTIIEAADTRKYVIGAFEMLFTKREDRPVKKHGTV